MPIPHIALLDGGYYWLASDRVPKAAAAAEPSCMSRGWSGCRGCALRLRADDDDDEAEVDEEDEDDKEDSERDEAAAAAESDDSAEDACL